MKIAWSGVGITDGRGKFGGSVASKNAAGAFIRTKVNPSNPKTSKQTSVRAVFSVLSGLWRSLTDAQRTGWSEAAPEYRYTDSLGATKVYTGNQLFVKLNASLRALDPGAALLSNAPSPASFPDFLLTGLSIVVSAPGVLDSFDLDFSEATVPAGWSLQVYATPPVSAGIMRPSESLFRLVASAPTVATGQTSVSTQYAAVFSGATEGAKVFTRVSAVNTTTGQSVDVGGLGAIVTG